VIPDQDILENREQAMRELPWVIPALTIMQLNDEDLDHLDAAFDTPGYWPLLNTILRRIESEAA
jgi:hypothetical protein